MAEGTFTIQELGRIGARTTERPDGGTPARFEWTSNPTAISELGGARATPKGAWTMGGEMRHKRTDYMGAKTPSIQVLGPKHKQHRFRGRWDDRYNFGGYAVQEMRRFEEMCFRGNLVRIAFQEQTFEALIVDWDFPYRRRWHIDYEFVCEVFDRTNAFNLRTRSPETTPTPSEQFDKINDIIEAALETAEVKLKSAGMLEHSMSDPALDETKALLAALSQSRDNLGDTLDQQELGVVDGALSSVSPFQRLATQFRTVGNGAFDIVDKLIMVRSDVSLGVKTALSVLDFEDWSRTLRFQGRLLTGIGKAAGDGMDERAKPDARRLYRPQAGESLYQISRRFYGTPHSWGLIYDRNNLTSFELTGNELLIIPEKGTG